MQNKNKKKLSILGAVAGLCLAPLTGGASLTMAAASAGLGFVGGNVFGELLGWSSNDNSGLERARENYNAQMEQWKILSEDRRAEIERLRKIEEEKQKQIRRNEEEIKGLETKLNSPSLSEEEKKQIMKRLVALQTDNKKLQDELGRIIDEIKDKEENKPPMPTPPTTSAWDRLSKYDKFLLAAVVLLVIYFLFLNNDRKK